MGNPPIGRAGTRRRSLLLTAPQRLEWMTEELPALRSREVLIRTDTSSISIGSELPLYRGVARAGSSPSYPLMTGYENVGTVVACGAEVATVAPGERVVGSYGHRTHGVLPEEKVIKVPDGVSDALALLTILTCDVAKGIRKVAPRPEEPALVTGAGAIGLLATFMLGAYGIRGVDVVEPIERRRIMAMRLGARRAVPPEQAGGHDAYPVAFECSGYDEAFSLLQSRMRREGRLCVLSDGNVEQLVLRPEFHERELTVVASSDGWDYTEHARWFFDAVRGRDTNLEEIFDLRVPVDGLVNVFEELAGGKMGPVKVLVDY